MRFGFIIRADEHEIFSGDAFAGQVGKEIHVRLPGRSVTGTVVAERVAEDRRSVELTIEVDGVEIFD